MNLVENLVSSYGTLTGYLMYLLALMTKIARGVYKTRKIGSRCVNVCAYRFEFVWWKRKETVIFILFHNNTHPSNQHIHPINQHILSQSVAQFSHSLDLDSLLRHSVPQSVARSLRSLDSNASKRKKSLSESVELVQGDLLNMPPDILLHHCDQHHL